MTSDQTTESVLEIVHEDATWDESIETLLAEIDAGSLNISTGEYALLDAIYEHIGKYASYPDTLHDQYHRQSRFQPPTSCMFNYHTERRKGRRRTYWVSEVSALYINYTHRWDSAWDADSSDGAERRDIISQKGTEKYCIGGLLIDPLVTKDIDEASTHIETQLSKLADRVEYILDLEQFSPTIYGDYLNEFRAPTDVKGVGEKTSEKLAARFAVYSNIVAYDNPSVSQYLTSTFAHSPDEDEIIERVEQTVKRYYKHSKDGTAVSSLKPEDLLEYPHPQPSSEIRSQTRAPRTSNTGERSADNLPDPPSQQ